MHSRLTLEPQQVHLWHAHLEPDLGGLAWRYLALLTAQERAQHARFVFEPDRNRYLLTRALVRTVLARYAPIDPADWEFSPGPHGRPEITNEHPLARRICFNISHARDLVVLAVSAGRQIGVDTESLARAAPLAVADRFFSCAEAQALRALAEHEQPQRFWELWTLKESYIKARGQGLAIPLDRFSFNLAGHHRIEIAFAPGFDDTAERWRFWHYQPDAHHLVALCIERAPHEHVEFVCRVSTPLRSEVVVEMLGRGSPPDAPTRD